MYPLTRHSWRFSLNRWYQAGNFPKFIALVARDEKKIERREAEVGIDGRTSRVSLLLNPNDCRLLVSAATPVDFTVVSPRNFRLFRRFISYGINLRHQAVYSPFA
jgi:hypothetical protein